MNKLSNTSTLIDTWIIAYQKLGISLKELGEKLVALIDSDADALTLLRERIPSLSDDFINGLLKVGRGIIDQRLFLTDAPGLVALRRCDISIQQKYLAQPFELVSSLPSETLMVQIDNMDRAQAAQAFDGTAPRSLAQQRLYLERKNKRQPPLRMDRPYRIKGRKIHIFAPCVLSREAILQMLSEL